MTMRTEHNRAVRRRAAVIRDRGSRRLVEPAIDALRRLNTRRADDTRINADPSGPSEFRYGHLTQSHDH